MNEDRKKRHRAACKKWYDLHGKENYHKNPGRQTKKTMAWSKKNPEKRAAIAKRWHEKNGKAYYNKPGNREKKILESKKSQLATKYGLSLQQHRDLLEGQGGRCKICGLHPEEIHPKNPYLYVDHSHSTGKIRGLLCFKCNTGLGVFRDDPDLLRKAALYLESNL